LINDNKYLKNQFKAVCKAYEVLSNPAMRKRYDEELKHSKSNSLISADQTTWFHSKTKTLDITFTIILGLITLVFGNYVRETLSSSKKAPVKKALAVQTVAVGKIKHHRKKHRFKIKTINNVSKGELDTVKVWPVHQAQINNNDIVSENDRKSVIETKIDNNINSPINTNNNLKGASSASENAKFLYVAYVKANETGIINLRKFDNYGSEIIKVIPTDSKVFVLEKGNTYYKVMFENNTGYVPKWTLQVK